jgi:cytochrome c oxidase subunit IV
MSSPTAVDETAEPQVREHAHPPAGEYVKIGLILAVLTLMEVATSYMDMDRTLQVWLLLGMMVVKFLLVVLWFMHLRFDSRAYGRAFAFGVALAMTCYGVVLMCFGVF